MANGSPMANLHITIHTADGKAHKIESSVHGSKAIVAVVFIKEGYIPSGRSETFIMTFVENTIAIGLPTANSHITIHTADGEAHKIESSVHGSVAIVTVALIKEGYIPSGRSGALVMTLVEDAITSGIPMANIHMTIHTADGEAH